MSTAPPSPPAEFTEKLKKDIRKSGFPLEVYVLNICSTKNTGRMPSVKYEYLDKLREIDLLAFYEAIDLEPKRGSIVQHTTTDLIIECKKSESKPWVFFSSASYKMENVTYFMKYSSELDLYFSKGRLPPLLAQIYPSITTSHYVDPKVPRCFSYYEAFRKNASAPSEIYAAIDSVLTYLLYRRGSQLSRRAELGVFSEFYLPIIVLDGLLFEASVGESDIEMRERQHLQLRTSHREETFVVDVVTRNRFQQFFNELETFHKELVSAIGSIRFPKDFKSLARERIRSSRHDFSDSAMLAMVMYDAKRRAKALRRSPRA